MEIRPVPLDGAEQAGRTSTRNSSLMLLSFFKRCIDPLNSLSTVSKAPGLQLSARILDVLSGYEVRILRAGPTPLPVAGSNVMETRDAQLWGAAPMAP